MDKKTRNIAALGAMVLVAGVLFVWLLYYLLGDPILAGGEQVYVRMDNGGGLKRGDAVELSGVQVGTVRRVDLQQPGTVTIELQITERLDLKADTRATVTGDVFGKHAMELLPGSALVGLESGDTIRGSTAVALPDIAVDLSTQARSVLAGADSLLSPNTVADMRQAMANLPGATKQLESAFAELRLAAVALRETATQIEDANAAAQLTATLEELENSARAITDAAETMGDSMDRGLGHFASVMEKIDRGEGTLGRMVNDTSLYTEFESALREMRFLASDFRARPGRYLNFSLF